MKIAVLGQQGGHRRELDDGALLLALQRGGRVTGVAIIGLAHGRPYLQPLDSDVPVFLNSHRLGASHWLSLGDRLEVGGYPLAISEAPDGLMLTTDLDLALRRAPASIGLVPPVHATVPRRRRIAAPVVFGALAILALVLMFLFSVRMVHVEVAPAPDRVSFAGAMPAIPVGAGYLALSGAYRLRAERSGYKPLDASGAKM